MSQYLACPKLLAHFVLVCAFKFVEPDGFGDRAINVVAEYGFFKAMIASPTASRRLGAANLFRARPSASRQCGADDTSANHSPTLSAQGQNFGQLTDVVCP